MARPAALVAWSSGKDSAWTLHRLRQAGEVEVVGLLTTVGSEADRVPMHHVRRRLLEAQADAAGLPLRAVAIPSPCPNVVYEAAMRDALARAAAHGVSMIAFGDLFLEDIRRYREEKLAGTGITPIFPLWGEPTAALAREMVAGGLGACITSVDTALLDASFAGRRFDAQLLAELPEGVDPCGERGEFHTFVHDGPMLHRPLAVVPGEVSARDGAVHLDLDLVAP
jgi:uncharacterized protein (TIGR00290 family)